MEIKKSKKEIVKLLLNQELDEKAEEEIVDIIVDKPLAVDIDKQDKETMTFKDKLADKMSSAFGSWGFILGFSTFIVLWIVVNTYCIYFLGHAIDSFPFILLNLFLSCVAALQAPIIMMSQNRQARKDALRNKNDYHVDLKSELILEILYERIDKLNKGQKEILNYLKDPDQELKLYTEEEIEDMIESRVKKELKKMEASTKDQ